MPCAGAQGPFRRHAGAIFGGNVPRSTGYLAGDFDLFHVGDLDLVRQAKALCDHLVVGVTTDEMSATPYVTHEERFEILRNVRFVDEVIVHGADIDRMWEHVRFTTYFAMPDRGDEFSRFGYGAMPERLRLLGVQLVELADLRDTESTGLRAALGRGRVRSSVA